VFMRWEYYTNFREFVQVYRFCSIESLQGKDHYQTEKRLRNEHFCVNALIFLAICRMFFVASGTGVLLSKALPTSAEEQPQGSCQGQKQSRDGASLDSDRGNPVLIQRERAWLDNACSSTHVRGAPGGQSGRRNLCPSSLWNCAAGLAG
jgi:hypothetical protein